MSLPTEQFAPLAARMRPKSIDEYTGQKHLLSHGMPLKRAIESGTCHSMILWGPPGTGKTSLAMIIAKAAQAKMITLSAVMSGVKDIRQAVEQAKSNQKLNEKTILFVDEVHRFNKSQQDAFLPHVESGLLTFIGATTENPSFALNNALLSRARVYVLKAINDEDIQDLLRRALEKDEYLHAKNLQLSSEALDALVSLSNGDARKSLMTLELAADLATSNKLELSHIEQASGSSVALYDKQGDAFYDLISAFHKSVRGSNADAALYWYARILVGGGDPLYVARRLLAIATEDIGTADPKAMQVTLNAWDIFHRVGPSEGERAVAEATVYCSLAPKSNAVYRAFKSAMSLARETGHSQVPMHLRNAPTKVLKSLGAGQGYRYAHDEPNAYAAGENYFPTDIKHQSLYLPSNRGFEKQLTAKLEYLRSLDRQSNQ